MNDIIQAFFNLIDPLAAAAAFPLLIAYIALGIDEFILDVYGWAVGLFPQNVKTVDVEELQSKKQKRLAIMVAAWKEYEVIARMIRGNMARVDYENHVFYVGVYPNDTKTVQVVRELCLEFPKNVRIVINSLPGPTSKGQMINQMVDRILADERAGDPADAVMIHDSEDLIHPASLLAVSEALDRADFIQVPVYSLPVAAKHVVAGVYMDEFAESHTKDMRVRSRLCPSFPAAGVGMVIKRALLGKFLEEAGGVLFNASSLTEDYEMGLKAAAHGAKSEFLYARTGPEHDDLIATREFFPKKLKNSIRQKTRWSVGIVFQGWQNLGWKGNLLQKYYLYRDRKGPLSNLVVILGLLLFSYGLLRAGSGRGVSDLFAHGIVPYLLVATNVLMVNRILQRMNATWHIYGSRAALMVPVRIVVGNVVNCAASMNSVKQHFGSLISGRAVKWAKTEHELPADFGMVPAAKAGATKGAAITTPRKPAKQASPPPAILGGLLLALTLGAGAANAAVPLVSLGADTLNKHQVIDSSFGNETFSVDFASVMSQNSRGAVYHTNSALTEECSGLILKK